MHLTSRRILLTLALLGVAAPACAANVLLVTQSSGSLTSEESARKTQFEAWGHTVTTIWDADTQANYDAALAAADVAYVSEEVDAADLLYKLRETTIGVVSEDQGSNTYLGFATTAGSVIDTTLTHSCDTSHPITAGFATSGNRFTSVSAPHTYMSFSTVAPGGQQLLSLGSAWLMLVVDPGGQLATSYNGDDTAAGRRVRMPLGGDAFAWSSLNSDGLTLFQNAIDWAATSSDPLVLHLKLDETSGTTAADSSPIANDGSFTGSSAPGAPGPGVSGGVAASFTGSGDRITVPSDTAYDLTDAITVSAWVNFDLGVTDQTYQQSLVSRFTWSGKKGFQLFTDQPNSNSLRFRVLNGSWKDAVWSNPDIEAGGWRHVVGTYDGATIRLYVDGELKDTEGKTDGLAAHTGADLSLGANLDGRLADVRIYNRVLDATEIAEMNGLVGHWKLDEPTGTTAADSSVLDNDGTYEGSGTSGATGPIDGTYAGEFDGTSGSRIDLPDADHDFSAGVTMAVWYRLNSLSGPFTDFFSLSNGALVDDLWLGLDSSGRLDLFLSDTADGASFRGLIEDSAGAVGEWHHAVAVIDASGNATLYRNGVVVKSGFTGLPRRVLRAQNGIGETSFGHTLDGSLADVRLYNRPLSFDEVSDIYGLTLGLVGHWKLTETSGTTAVDSGPSGADGTYENGVALDQGGPYPGVTAPAFDGSNDHVELPTINARFQSGLTIAAWIKPDATLASGQFHEILDLSNGSQVDQILLSYNGAAGLQLFLTDTVDGSALRTIEDNTGFAAGRWVHCAATIDSSGYGKIYRNGKVTKSGFFTSFPASVARSTATIGKSAFGDHFGGGLQDVRLYNYELSAAEIHELYGLVGQWDFDEGSETTIAERTGAASDATFYSGTPAWIDGVRGNALKFDGTNSTRTETDFNPPETGALAFWFRRDGKLSNTERILGLNTHWEVQQKQHGAIHFRLGGQPNGFRTRSIGPGNESWRHLIAQFNADTDAYEVYVDGVLETSESSTTDLAKQAAAQLSFGTRTGASNGFNGALDNVRIYNRWLNPAEIAELYGLVGWWRMEETSGSTVADSSGMGNHGTLSGSATWSANAKEGGGSLELDGTNYVDVPGVPVDSESVSIAGWARLAAADSNGSELISLGNHFAIRMDDGYYGTSAFAYNGSAFDFAGVGYSQSGSGWRHVAAVFDGQDLELRVYVDGVLRSTEPASGPVALSGLGTDTRFGEHAAGETTRSFTGLMDDLRLYNRALLPEEVRTLYYGEYVIGPRIVKWVEVANP